MTKRRHYGGKNDLTGGISNYDTRIEVNLYSQGNIALLEEKKVAFGDHFPTHFQYSLDEAKASIRELEDVLQRRLQALLMKAATYGLSADPSISMEIEDIQAYFDQQKSEVPKFI